MISIVLPVYNAKSFVENTLLSIARSTVNPFELIIIDDNSDKETKEFLESVRIDLPGCSLKLIRNKKQMWINHNWNIGASVATQPYIAFLNSDITLSKGWDEALINDLKHCTISCPYEKRGGKLYGVDPLIASCQVGMIKGMCFMIKSSDVKDLFPIPSQLFHFCGDNYLAWKAKRMEGVNLTVNATITHAVTASGRLVDRQTYNHLTIRDVLEFEKLSKLNFDPILRNLYFQIGIKYRF